MLAYSPVLPNIARSPVVSWANENLVAFFDFAFTQAIPSGLTFARASAGTQLGSTGVLQTAAIDVARYPYAYQNGVYVPKGYLSGIQSTNLVLYSNDLSQASWFKSNATPTYGYPGIDGGNTASLLTADATATSHTAFSGFAATTGQYYTHSEIAKYSGYNLQLLGSTQNGVFGATEYANFDLQNGAVGTVGAGALATIDGLGNGWYRCTITVQALTTATGAIGTAIINSASASRAQSFTGDGTSGVILNYCQTEAGKIATTPILTTGAQATRSADTMGGTLSTVIPGFNAAEGTIVIKSKAPIISGGTGATRYWIQFDDGTNNNRIIVFMPSGSSDVRYQVINGGVNQASIDLSRTEECVIAASWKANNFRLCVNGTLGTQDTSGTVPAVTNMRIGYSTTANQLQGTEEWIKYYNTGSLSDAQLQAVGALS